MAMTRRHGAREGEGVETEGGVQKVEVRESSGDEDRPHVDATEDLPTADEAALHKFHR